MKEAPGSSETSVLTRATRRNNPEDTILVLILFCDEMRSWASIADTLATVSFGIDPVSQQKGAQGDSNGGGTAPHLYVIPSSDIAPLIAILALYLVSAVTPFNTIRCFLFCKLIGFSDV
jgi:hypothetical protein